MPPVIEEYDGGKYFRVGVPLNFASPTAPDGESWTDFLTKAYTSVTWPYEYDGGSYSFPNGPDPYADYGVYWQQLLQAIAGNHFGFDESTGARVAQPSAEFRQALNQVDPAVLQQAGYNLEALNRREGFGSPLGDQFFSALTFLGLATGGAALAGGFSAAPAVGGAAAADIAPLAASPGLTAPAASVGGGAAATGGGSAAVLGSGGAAATGGAGLTVTGPAAAAVPAATSATTASGILGTGLTLGDAVRLGGTALSVGSTLAGASGPEQRTTSNVVFAPETRALIGGIEFPLTASARDEQSATVGPLLSGSAFRPEIGARYGASRATNAVRSSVARGARGAGITDLGPAFEDTGVLMPQLTSSLRELALQRGAQNTTAVAPGLQPFLAPSTSQRTTGGGPSALETGFSLASTLGSAYLSTL